MKTSKPRTCKRCSGAYTYLESYSRYCLSCREAIRAVDIGTKTIGSYREIAKQRKLPPSLVMSEIRGHCRMMNSHREQSCQVCGYDFYVERAHIKAVNEFEDHALISEVNNPDNVLLLCPNHHKEFDRCAEKRKEILVLVAQLDRAAVS